MVEKAKEKNVNFLIPVDTVVAKELNDAERRVVKTKIYNRMKWVWIIGPETVKLFAEALIDAKTVVWMDLWAYLKCQILHRWELMLLQRNFLYLESSNNYYWWWR